MTIAKCKKKTCSIGANYKIKSKMCKHYAFMAFNIRSMRTHNATNLQQLIYKKTLKFMAFGVMNRIAIRRKLKASSLNSIETYTHTTHNFEFKFLVFRTHNTLGFTNSILSNRWLQIASTIHLRTKCTNEHESIYQRNKKHC